MTSQEDEMLVKMIAQRMAGRPYEAFKGVIQVIWPGAEVWGNDDHPTRVDIPRLHTQQIHIAVPSEPIKAGGK